MSNPVETAAATQSLDPHRVLLEPVGAPVERLPDYIAQERDRSLAALELGAGEHTLQLLEDRLTVRYHDCCHRRPCGRGAVS